jgi:hypothetical protein
VTVAPPLLPRRIARPPGRTGGALGRLRRGAVDVGNSDGGPLIVEIVKFAGDKPVEGN